MYADKARSNITLVQSALVELKILYNALSYFNISTIKTDLIRDKVESLQSALESATKDLKVIVFDVENK